MVSYDIQLFELHETIINDSVDARAEIFRLATENVARDIVEFDELALPAALYNYRIAEINLHSAFNYWAKEVEDTSHVGLKLDVLAELRKQQSGNIILLKKLKNSNNASERLIFNEFITERFQDDSGIAEYIRQQTIDVQNDSLLLDSWVNRVREEDKYAYWNDESIALVAGDQIANDDATKFSTLMIDSISERILGFYAWMQNTSSLSLSFGISPSSRALDTLYTVQINPLVVNDQELTNQKFLSDSLGTDQRIWVLNSNEPDSASLYQIQVFTTNLTLGAGWNKEYSVSEIPQAIKIDQTNNTVSLIGNNEETILILDEYGKKQETFETEGD